MNLGSTARLLGGPRKANCPSVSSELIGLRAAVHLARSDLWARAYPTKGRHLRTWASDKLGVAENRVDRVSALAEAFRGLYGKGSQEHYGAEQ